MERKVKSSAYYPMFVDIRGRRCVVIGGGEVAMRKVARLVDCGGDVEVISPELCSGLQIMVDKGEINFQPRNYQPGDLFNAFIAIAATDNNAVNREIVREAHEEGALVNAVDELEEGDFIVPSCFQRGDIIISVSTEARSPALARKVRMELEKCLGEEYAIMAKLVRQVRIELKNQGIKVDGNTWQEALDIDVFIKLIRQGDNERAKAVLLENLKKRQR